MNTRLIFILIIIFFLRLNSVCHFPDTSCLQGSEPKETPNFITRFPILVNIRNHAYKKIETYFPSPISDLLLGTTLGINTLSKTPTFNDMLKRSGTVHVVVVSGFNINLIFGLLKKIFGEKSRYNVILISAGILLSFLYALISGFEPPVVRAWLMGSVSGLAIYSGYAVLSGSLLVFVALIMLCFDPMLLLSISFQLSFLATSGLVYLSNIVTKCLDKYSPWTLSLFEDIVPSLSAQLAVFPIISYYFGTISLASILANVFSLWTIPIITILGLVFIVISFNNILALAMSFVIYPFAYMFVYINHIFSLLQFSQINLKFSFPILVVHYLFLVSAILYEA